MQREPVDHEQRLGTIMWRRRYLIAACVLVSVALSLAATFLQEKVYEATALVQVSSPNLPPGESTDLANQGLARNYATVLLSRSFLSRISPRVDGGRLTVGQLRSALDAEAVQDTALITVRARASSPTGAQRLGNQVVDAFLDSLQQDAAARVQRQQAELDRVVIGFNRRIFRLEQSGDDSAATAERIRSLEESRDAVISQRATLVANVIAQGASAGVAAAASAPLTPVRPRPLLNGIAGLVLGLLLGTGLAWLRERFRPSVHTGEEAVASLGIPLLGTIPLRRRVRKGDPVLAEAYELLRANLIFQSPSHDLQVLTFVSNNPGVGKTSAVEGLGYTGISNGGSVLMIDADLRARALSRRLGHDDSPGVTDVLRGQVNVDDAIVEMEPGLSLLPAGPPVANPPSLLDGPRMRDLVRGLRNQYDGVILDSPPVAHLADGLVLASLSDGVVIVARAGVSKHSDLTAALRNLRQSGTTVVGMLMYEPLDVDEYYYPGIAPSQREPAESSSVS